MNDFTIYGRKKEYIYWSNNQRIFVSALVMGARPYMVKLVSSSQIEAYNQTKRQKIRAPKVCKVRSLHFGNPTELWNPNSPNSPQRRARAFRFSIAPDPQYRQISSQPSCPWSNFAVAFSDSIDSASLLKAYYAWLRSIRLTQETSGSPPGFRVLEQCRKEVSSRIASLVVAHPPCQPYVHNAGVRTVPDSRLYVSLEAR